MKRKPDHNMLEWQLTWLSLKKAILALISTCILHWECVYDTQPIVHVIVSFRNRCFFATHTVSYDWKWTRSLGSGNSKACFVLFIIQLSCSYGLVYHRKSSKILLHIFYREWDIMRYGQLKKIKKYAQHCITVIVMFDYKADANDIVCVSQRANVIDSSFDCEYIGCKRLFELIVNMALCVFLVWFGQYVWNFIFFVFIFVF